MSKIVFKKQEKTQADTSDLFTVAASETIEWKWKSSHNSIDLNFKMTKLDNVELQGPIQNTVNLRNNPWRMKPYRCGFSEHQKIDKHSEIGKGSVHILPDDKVQC